MQFSFLPIPNGSNLFRVTYTKVREVGLACSTMLTNGEKRERKRIFFLKINSEIEGPKFCRKLTLEKSRLSVRNSRAKFIVPLLRVSAPDTPGHGVEIVGARTEIVG